MKGGPIQKKCEACNSVFFVYPYRKDEARFCSHQCIRTNHERACEICGIMFKPSNKGGRFCSQECFGKSQVGRTPWNRGLSADKDERVRRSINAAHAAARGITPWNKGRKGDPAWNKGKLGSTNTGRTHWKKGRVPWNKGKVMLRGPDHWNWRGGENNKLAALRKTPEYREWRTTVFKRDNYTCCFCGCRGGKIHADHINSFRNYPELRLEVSNGRTLCVSCHRKTDTWGGKSKRKRAA